MSDKIAGAALSLSITLEEMNPFDWSALTCEEVESFAYLLRVTGRSDVAENMVRVHAAGDVEGDLHFQGQPEWAHRFEYDEPTDEHTCAECGATYMHPLDTNETCPSSLLHSDNQDSMSNV